MIRRTRTIALSLCLLLVGGSMPLQPQPAGPVTVGLIRGLLLDTLNELKTLLTNATGNTKSLGESLQANAQNVITEIDRRLGDKLGYTFDRLDETERRLVEDAERLIEQMERASRALIGGVGAEARRSLAEADIVAYNASYSLPCRSQMPRLVYSVPEVIMASVDRPEVKIRGNFLSIGRPPVVTAGGRPATLISRNANEYLVRLPAEILKGVEQEKTIAIEARPVGLKKNSVLWFFCDEEEAVAPFSLSVPVIIRPPTSFDVAVKFKPSAELPEFRDQKYSFYESNNDCGANYRVDRNWCLPGNGKIVSWSGPATTTANCGSRVIATRPSGDNCVLVDAKIEGCGYNNFLVARECRGRGWLGYDIVLHGKYMLRKPLETSEVKMVSPDGVQRTFLATYDKPLPEGAQNVSWAYEAVVGIKVGSRRETIVLSDINPNASGVSTRVGDGRLTIQIDRTATEGVGTGR